MTGRRKSKKIWSRPLLTVVVRGKPEENLLVGCKTTGSGVIWALSNSNQNCRVTGGCTDCTDTAIS